MSRRVIWLQILIGWLPLGVLFTVMIALAHRTSIHSASVLALRMIVTAAALGLFVQRLVERYPWPRPMRPTFVVAHLGYAFAYSTALILANSALDSALHLSLRLATGPSFTLTFLTGVWLYVMIAGVTYTSVATTRAALAEANAARAQLAALRAQLHPHFLFNALHSVVQLIPREPRRAAEAAEQLGALLRTTVEEDRDLVTLAEECAFVERYLVLEKMRFGDRLRVTIDVDEDARGGIVPVFALQTLVENAVRHGAAPSVGATDVSVKGRRDGSTLRLTVHDTGAGTAAQGQQKGTGLDRLRERLQVLYGGTATVTSGPAAEGGYSALLVVPFEEMGA